MNSISEKWIRTCVREGLVDYSGHAKCRMLQRQIDDEKILNCILYGKVIEIQKQFEDIHVLFQEATNECPEIYVVVAASYPYPVIVTVCRTMDEVWEFCNGILKRRKK